MLDGSPSAVVMPLPARGVQQSCPIYIALFSPTIGVLGYSDTSVCSRYGHVMWFTQAAVPDAR